MLVDGKEKLGELMTLQAMLTSSMSLVGMREAG